MRVFVAAFVFFAFASPAPAETAAPAQTAGPAGASFDSARAMLQALVVESGVADAAVMRAFEQSMPGFRANIIDPMMAQLTPQQRTQMEAYAETLPDRARARAGRALPGLLDEAAQRAAGRFTEAEMTSISAFLAREEVRPLLFKVLADGAASITAEEQRVVRGWSRTEAGRAFMRERETLMVILQGSMVRAQRVIAAGLVADVFAGVCQAMADTCPAEYAEQAAAAAL